jgi:hypothetical protein
MWNSVIFSASVPAAEWKDWQGNFRRMEDSFGMTG